MIRECALSFEPGATGWACRGGKIEDKIGDYQSEDKS